MATLGDPIAEAFKDYIKTEKGLPRFNNFYNITFCRWDNKLHKYGELTDIESISLEDIIIDLHNRVKVLEEVIKNG